MQKTIKGFSLIELLVVVSILGILAAISVSSYAAYSTRSKMAAVLSMSEKYAKEMQTYYSKNGTWPASLTALGYTNANNTYAGDNGCMFSTASAGNSLFGSIPYVDNVCVYQHTISPNPNGNPAGGRLDIVINAGTLGLTAGNIFLAQKWTIVNGTMVYSCFLGGGSFTTYGGYAPSACAKSATDY